MPRYASKSGGAGTPKEIRTNQKGEITSWDSTTPDGKLLKLMVEQGILTTETGAAVKKDYPQFRKYATRTLSSALSNARNALQKQVDLRQSRGEQGESFSHFETRDSFLGLFVLSSLTHTLLAYYLFIQCFVTSQRLALLLRIRRHMSQRMILTMSTRRISPMQFRHLAWMTTPTTQSRLPTTPKR